jgi:Icc-related predicted phosphoesterase
LQDSGVTIGGVRFYGSPWTPEFNAWAFNLARGAALRRRWAQIPRTTDVLITHGPPRGILDRVGRDHTGCDDLADAIRLIQPPLHVFGHIHEGYGVARHGRTTLINASSLDDKGQATNPPIVVDLHDGVVTVQPIPPRADQAAFEW